MKNFKVVLVLMCTVLFSLQTIDAQEAAKSQEKVHKTTISEVPNKVKEALKNYSGYRIDNEATFTKKNNKTVYTFRVQKRNWTNYLLINENGKIMGIASKEGTVAANNY